MNKFYIARAVKGDFEDEWFAEWAAPGQEPDYVYFEDDPQSFESPEAAERKATRVLLDSLNSQRFEGSVENFEKLTGPELAALIQDSGLNRKTAAQLLGWSVEKLMEFIRELPFKEGGPPRVIPFFLHWALPLLKNEKNLEIASEIVSNKMTLKPKYVDFLKNKNVKLSPHRIRPKDADEKGL